MGLISIHWFYTGEFCLVTNEDVIYGRIKIYILSTAPNVKMWAPDRQKGSHSAQRHKYLPELLLKNNYCFTNFLIAVPERVFALMI